MILGPTNLLSILVIGSEAVSYLLGEIDDGLVERNVLLVVEECDEAGVLVRCAGSSCSRQSGGAIRKISRKQCETATL